MRKDIFGLSKKFVQDTDPEECLDNFESMRVIPSDNPVYEDPRDVLEKSTKSIRKRSPKLTKDIKAIIKDHKKKLTKKYEGLIVTLMEKCEENILVISERESQLVKLKQKLKEVLEYNKLFAEENDQIKSQYSTMVGYVEDCKRVIEELKVHNKDLEDEVKLHQVPEKEVSTAIPLVEICISCNSRDILLRQARDHNSRLHSDMQALKDVLYRLNVQLSRYQEKIRSSVQSISKDTHDNIITIHKPEPGLESFLTSGFKVPDIGNTRDHGTTKGIQDDGDQSQRTKMVDVSGLLSAQALGPLFDAYQEAIQEKENLILDYEKQFEIMNRKTKTVVDENKDLKDKIQATEESNNSMRQNVKKFTVEKETYDIERATLLERCEKVEAKLKEVYELYEDKMAAMMRDYETVHREYFATKNSLSAAENRITQLDAALRAPSLRTVPADLHERRVDNCKRLLDDLKHQYGMEIERKNELISKLQHEKTVLEDKHKQLTTEHEANCEELKIALKNVILYRKAAKIFRQRYKCSMSTIQTLRRSRRRNRALNRLSAPPVTPTLERLDKIKQEIKQVKSCAYNSLSELERRMVQQERGAARDLMIQRREAQRLQLLVEHKEHIIKHLIDKVADVEEVRLSQGSSRVLQGVPDSPPERPPKVEARDLKRDPVKLVPGPGGYFHGDTREGLGRKN